MVVIVVVYLTIVTFYKNNSDLKTMNTKKDLIKIKIENINCNIFLFNTFYILNISNKFSIKMIIFCFFTYFNNYKIITYSHFILSNVRVCEFARSFWTNIMQLRYYIRTR